MTENKFPYLPYRWNIYNKSELYMGLDEKEFSYSATVDFKIYKHFVTEGKSTPENPFTSMMQALHDNSITQATKAVLKGHRVVAIMGGHDMRRDSNQYRDVVCLSQTLTQYGILMCSGGATGAMEACHLGASLAHSDDNAIDSALLDLSKAPEFPNTKNIVTPDGNVDNYLVNEAHKWLYPAYKISCSIANPSNSLAIPTWHYGFEPPTPFATHIAKYFQNSIREDGLLAVAKYGIIFTEGKAGTLQEIFQDAAQNHYKTFDWFSPMVFLGVEYWTKSLPIWAVLKKLFKKDDFETYVLITDDVTSAANFINDFKPSIEND